MALSVKDELGLDLDENGIYDVQFGAFKPGYDPLAVDSFLDGIMGDYERFEAFYRDAKAALSQKADVLSALNNRISTLETQNVVLKKKIDEYEAVAGSDMKGKDNLDLLRRISKLEEALYDIGIDPSSIKA